MKKTTPTPLTASTLTRMAVGFLTILAIVAACVGAIAAVGCAFQWASSFMKKPYEYLLWVPANNGMHPSAFSLGLNLILSAIVALVTMTTLVLIVYYLWLQLSPVCLKIGTAVLAKIKREKATASC